MPPMPLSGICRRMQIGSCRVPGAKYAWSLGFLKVTPDPEHKGTAVRRLYQIRLSKQCRSDEQQVVISVKALSTANSYLRAF
jgi:hypothetical protein